MPNLTRWYTSVLVLYYTVLVLYSTVLLSYGTFTVHKLLKFVLNLYLSKKIKNKK